MSTSLQITPSRMPALSAAWAWLRLNTYPFPWALSPRVDDSAAVRAMADSVRWESPGFASDLDAAAERYERETERGAPVLREQAASLQLARRQSASGSSPQSP